MRLLTTKGFEKDFKLIKKRGKDREKLWNIVGKILARKPLDPRHRKHRLSGNWSFAWECHIEPDWLLIWEERDDEIILARTGTHSDLF